MKCVLKNWVRGVWKNWVRDVLKNWLHIDEREKYSPPCVLLSVVENCTVKAQPAVLKAMSAVLGAVLMMRRGECGCPELAAKRAVCLRRWVLKKLVKVFPRNKHSFSGLRTVGWRFPSAQ